MAATPEPTNPERLTPEEKAQRKKKRRRRRRLFSLGFVSLVVIAAVVINRTGWVTREVERVLRTEVQRNLGMAITFDRIGFSWRHLAVEADGVSLTRPGQAPMVRVDTLDIRPSFSSLFTRHVKISSIAVDGGALELRFRRGVLENGPVLPPAGPPQQGPPDLPFHDIAVSDLHVRIVHDQFGTLDLPSVDVDVRNIDDRRLLLGVLAQGGSIEGAPCFNGRIQHVEARAEISHWNLLRIALANIEGAGMHLRVREADVPFSLEHGIDPDRVIHAAAEFSSPLHILTCPIQFPRLAPRPHGDIDLGLETSFTLRGLTDPHTRTFQATGRVRARNLALEVPFTDGKGRYSLGDDDDIRFEADGSQVRIVSLEMHHSGGTVVSPGTHPERPLVIHIADLAHVSAEGHLDLTGIEIHRLMHDLGITEFAKVLWNISASAELHAEMWRFGETPDARHPALWFDLEAETRNFALLQDFYVRTPQYETNPIHPAPPQRSVLSIPRAAVTGQIAIDAQHVRFQHLTAVFGQNNRSRLQVDAVTLRTAHDERLPDVWLTNAHGENIALEDVGHIAGMPIGGTGSFTAEGGGPFPDPIITGQAHLRGFLYNELPLGDFDTRPTAPWRFRGVRVDAPAIDAHSGRSTFVARNSYLDFSRWTLSAGTHIASDSFFLRDYYHMFKLENDPVWEAYGGQTMPRCAVSLAARGRAGDVPCVDPSDTTERDARRPSLPAGSSAGHIDSDVTFVLGRPGDDPAGVMDVDFTGRNLYLTGFDEALDHTDLRFHFTWVHRLRGFQGSRQNVEYVRGRFAGGTIDASGSVDLGGLMHFVGNVRNVQVARTETLRATGIGGVLNGSGVLEGQPDAQRWNIDGDVRSLTVASRNLGDAYFHVRSRPDAPRSADPRARPPRNLWSVDATALGSAMRIEAGLLVPWRGTTWRDVDGVSHADWDRDWSHSLVDGHLEMTRAIDLVPLLPARVASRLGADGHATVRARVDVDRAILGDLTHANARLDVTELDVGAQGLRLALAPTETLAMCVHEGAYWIEPAAATSPAACDHIPDRLRTHRAAIARAEPTLPSARFVGPEGTRLAVSGGGTVAGRLALTLDGQVDLARIATLAPGVSWARGTGTFQVRATGDTANPELRGVFELHDGALAAAVLPDPVEDIDLRVRLDGTDIVLDQAVAAFGSSSINLTGGLAHLAGRGLDRVDIPVRVQNLSMVPMPGVEVALDANTRLLWNPGEALPLFSGDVTLTRVRYTRPVNLSQDASGETRVAGSDSAETPYDPANDHVRLNLRIHAREPIRVANNIAEAEVTIAENERPFRIVGTDQRTGVIGTLNIPRGRVIIPLFRGSDFEIVRGRIEFENPESIEPNFDVSAQTEVRRGTNVARNQWRVALHAYGRPDRFALDMTSEPALSRDDIALLLTFGATRAELDQAGAESVGQAIAVQALATATGIDRTLRQAIPVIDEFRIGSAYSPSQGRTVPQVAIGRRLNDRVRVAATVNTTETREMRATVDVRVSDHTSMQLGYDNINDQGSSQIGNLGADVRWRLEFE